MGGIIINKQVIDGETIFFVEGQLNTDTSSDLQSALEEEFSVAAGITVNLSKLHYISSAGLRVLLAAQKKSKLTGVSFRLSNLTRQVWELFDMVGFTEFFKII
ncbi:MAG: STAS domain-containing protein [Synergistaceae bacterium]|jgi:anti-sigma B factor antagonist|nr:STAS domain-containing protein [Synergistaceae bacterium]